MGTENGLFKMFSPPNSSRKKNSLLQPLSSVANLIKNILELHLKYFKLLIPARPSSSSCQIEEKEVKITLDGLQKGNWI